MEFLNEKTIQLDRELSLLDLLVQRFVQLLEKHVPYVLVSGYVAILFGRSRSTEDVDLLIEKLSLEQFRALYQELQVQGFWAINADNLEELYDMLQEGLSVRFAEKEKVIPNFEIKLVKDLLDSTTLNEKMKVMTSQGHLFIAPLALQVAYSKYLQKNPKDLEDAEHLQLIFNLPEEKVEKYRLLLKEYGRL